MGLCLRLKVQEAYDGLKKRQELENLAQRLIASKIGARKPERPQKNPIITELELTVGLNHSVRVLSFFDYFKLS